VAKLQEAGIEIVSLDELAAESDFVVMAAKVTPESKGVFSKKYFDLMKQSAFFINTARAALVDYEALTESLERGAIAGAALDVYPVEPLPNESKLRQLSNVVLSPHLAGATREVVLHHSTMVVDDLLALKAGQTPSRIINQAVIENFMKNGGLR
jgi:D-3-phosphoglycerate dehydrogenase